MELSELKNVTASCGSGEKDSRTWHKVLAGREGTYGPELNINVTEIERAIKAGARTWTNKSGEKMLTLRPKLWGDKPATTPTPHETAKADGYAPSAAIDDKIPF